MSQAFVKESDEQWLHEIAPTMSALMVYLSRQNNGIRVYEKKAYFCEQHQKDVHEMSDGMLYTKNDKGQWDVILD